MSLSRRHLLATPLLLPAAARGQAAWPNRPIRLIVPFPPGGGVDLRYHICIENQTPSPVSLLSRYAAPRRSA